MTAWLLLPLLGCSPCDQAPGCLPGSELPAALLSVRAVGDDLWFTGASPPDGDPVAQRRHAGGTDTVDTSAFAGRELWWSWASATEAVFVGDGGLLLELDRGSGTLTAVAGTDPEATFFGVWGASAEQLWAVGSGPLGPVLWRRDAGAWAAITDAPGSDDPDLTYFKVHGTAADDAWLVGSRGHAMHWDGSTWTVTPTNAELETANTPLLTVDASGPRPIAVGGQGNAVILEFDGSAWRDMSPQFQPGLNGVCSDGSSAWAVGLNGSRSQRIDGSWVSDDATGELPVTTRDWHGCAIDAEGGLWTVGGRITSRPLIDGVVGYQGPNNPDPIDPTD